MNILQKANILKHVRECMFCNNIYVYIYMFAFLLKQVRKTEVERKRERMREKEKKPGRGDRSPVAILSSSTNSKRESFILFKIIMQLFRRNCLI